jgi:RNA polymerase sigma-70 factor (ECF subfamily)
MTYRLEPETTDVVLVARARDGDDEAFGELVRRHQAAALRLAGAVLGSNEEARDVVQEAFVKAYRALGRFRGDAPVRPWLLRIVANEAKNSRRGRTRRADREVRHGTLAVVSPPAPDELAALSMDARHLLDALATLGHDDREVLVYRYVIGLTETETAVSIGAPVGTVKSRSSRALTRLRHAMGVEEDR